MKRIASRTRSQERGPVKGAEKGSGKNWLRLLTIGVEKESHGSSVVLLGIEKQAMRGKGYKFPVSETPMHPRQRRGRRETPIIEGRKSF